MFRIGEFSKLTQVSVRMLRYYDETGLLKPAKIDAWSGYRMYSVEQIPVLNKIIYLRDSGFHVSEIAAALSCDDETLTIEMFDKKQDEIQKNIQLEQEKLMKIDIAKQELLNGKNEIHYHITIKSIPSYYVLSLRKIIPNYYAEGELWKELSEFVKERNIDISEDTFSIYYDEDYREENVDVELCVKTNKIGQDMNGFHFYYTKPVPIMACTMVYGDFSHISTAYRAFAKWLQENSQYTMSGENRQIVHRGPWNEENPEKYLTEIQIPLKKTSCE